MSNWFGDFTVCSHENARIMLKILLLFRTERLENQSRPFGSSGYYHDFILILKAQLWFQPKVQPKHKSISGIIFILTGDENKLLEAWIETHREVEGGWQSNRFPVIVLLYILAILYHWIQRSVACLHLIPVSKAKPSHWFFCYGLTWACFRKMSFQIVCTDKWLRVLSFTER